MSSDNPLDITELLERARAGDRKAPGELLPIVYEQLRARARREMAGEPQGHTLQPTALVHEAYVRLVGAQELEWESRAHFYVAAAEAMRRILIEHARKKRRIKRGGDRRRVPLDVIDLAERGHPEEILSLDQAIGRIGKRDPQLADLVRLRFYAGLSEEETAAALGVSARTVRREWSVARAWLLRELGAERRGTES